MKNTDVIFFVGRSGAGKGTQARLLAEKLGFFYWEMGGIIRKEIEAETDLGVEIKDLVNRGLFLDDHRLMRIVESHLDEIPTDKGILFDGIPRRLSQAYYIVGLLRGMGRKDMTTIYIDVSRREAIDRLEARAKSEHRSDDTDLAIARRLDQFDIETMPVVEYFRDVTEFYYVDGRPAIEEVTAEVNKIFASK